TLPGGRPAHPRADPDPLPPGRRGPRPGAAADPGRAGPGAAARPPDRRHARAPGRRRATAPWSGRAVTVAGRSAGDPAPGHRPTRAHPLTAPPVMPRTK